MKKFFGLAAGIFLCAALLIGGNFSKVEAATDGMQLFREALTKTSPNDNYRIFHEDAFFIAPDFQVDLDFLAKIDKADLNMAGELFFWAVDNAGTQTEQKIPFYIKQVGNDMKIYYETDKKWYVYDAPSVAAHFADFLATPTPAEIDEMISDVKEVTVLQDNATRCTMLVKLDSEKLANGVAKDAAANPADKGTAEDSTIQDAFFKYVDEGLRNSEIWYVWTVDKKNWQTVAISLHLSNFVQATALAALNDNPQLPEELKVVLETLAFYSDAKAYTTYMSGAAANKFELPKKALKAKPVKDLEEGKPGQNKNGK